MKRGSIPFSGLIILGRPGKTIHARISAGIYLNGAADPIMAWISIVYEYTYSRF